MLRHKLSSQPRRAFTLIELLVVISIIALLISILMPALRGAREAAKAMSCLSKLRQISVSLSVYTGDHQEFLPPGSTSPSRGTWVGVLADGQYMPAPDLSGGLRFSSGFMCPSGRETEWNGVSPITGSDPHGATWERVVYHRNLTWVAPEERLEYSNNYGLNAADYNLGSSDSNKNSGVMPFTRYFNPTNSEHRLHRISDFTNMSKLVYVFDGLNTVWGKPFHINGRHAGGKQTNILLADGHAAGFDRSTLPDAGFSKSNVQNLWPDPHWRTDQ